MSTWKTVSLQKGIPQNNTEIFAKSSSYQKKKSKIAHWVLGVVLSFLWCAPNYFSERSVFSQFFFRFSAKKITVNYKITHLVTTWFFCIKRIKKLWKTERVLVSNRNKTTTSNNVQSFDSFCEWSGFCKNWAFLPTQKIQSILALAAKNIRHR